MGVLRVRVAPMADPGLRKSIRGFEKVEITILKTGVKGIII